MNKNNNFKKEITLAREKLDRHLDWLCREEESLHSSLLSVISKKYSKNGK